jgi:hypothetical protein
MVETDGHRNRCYFGDVPSLTAVAAARLSRRTAIARCRPLAVQFIDQDSCSSAQGSEAGGSEDGGSEDEGSEDDANDDHDQDSDDSKDDDGDGDDAELDEAEIMRRCRRVNHFGRPEDLPGHNAGGIITEPFSQFPELIYIFYKNTPPKPNSGQALSPTLRRLAFHPPSRI